MDFDEVIPFNMSFSKQLVELQVPKQLRQLPTIGLYNGSFDLNDHLWRFESALAYIGTSASIMCHASPLSLKSTMLKRFQSLPLRFINSWLDLREKFRFAFATSKERPKIEVNLRLIQQGLGEPLNGYILRFNKEARVMEQPGVVLMLAKDSVWEGSFLHIHHKNATYHFGGILEKGGEIY